MKAFPEMAGRLENQNFYIMDRGQCFGSCHYDAGRGALFTGVLVGIAWLCIAGVGGTMLFRRQDIK